MTYITVDDIRAEGVTVETASNSRIASRILLAQAKIEQWTGRFFDAREGTITIDGTGQSELYLSVPILSLDAVTIDEVSKTVSDFDIPSETWPCDCRFNPYIRYKEGRFGDGDRNVTLTGFFGFIEMADSTTYATPLLIQEVCKRIVIRDLAMLSDQDAQEDKKRWRILSETTDGHSYRLSPLQGGDEQFTGDYDIDKIINMFQYRPISMSVVDKRIGTDWWSMEFRPRYRETWQEAEYEEIPA